MEQHNVIRPRNYLYELLVLLNGVVLVGIWWVILRSVRPAVMAGCLSYLVLAWSLRFAFQRHHKKGMKFIRAKNFPAAAAEFQKSFDFFEKHPAIDKFRFITMFSSNAIPYRQMALNNMGICYLHMGEHAKALCAFRKLAQLNSNHPYLTRIIEELSSSKSP